jgi:hypothetical protein
MSNLPFTKEYISQLFGFIALCKKDPNILRKPEFSFFKSYIESLGGKIPVSLFETVPEPKKEREPESDTESDIELDNSGVIGRYIYLFTYLFIYFVDFSAVMFLCDTKRYFMS